MNFQANFNQILRNVELVVRGKRNQIAMALSCVLAEGHLLLEDVPGTGKTTMAKAIAASMGGSMSRIQFTPDLLPSDVTGGMIYNQNDGQFETYRGPIFANVVLADEINRASPKTQAALLEVMEESQVTLGSETTKVPTPFVVIATQNPIEQEGTYRLPEAQLDRFTMRSSLGYPSKESTIEVMQGNASGMAPEDLEAVVTTNEVNEMIQLAKQVHMEPSVYGYIVDLVEATREMPEVRLGASPRGAIALGSVSRTVAAAQGRDYVTADDVRRVAEPVLAHRLLLTPDAELQRTSAEALVEGLLDTVVLPTVVSTP